MTSFFRTYLHESYFTVHWILLTAFVGKDIAIIDSLLLGVFGMQKCDRLLCLFVRCCLS